MIDITKVPLQVIYVLHKIEKCGYNAYLTGGATRDILLNRKPHDFDVTTSAPLEVLQSLFSNCKVVGSTFGVVLVNIDGMDIQIAKFRTEYGYSDYRHPDTIIFTDDIMEDLERRDFTINTFSMNNKGNLIHVTGAWNDLKNGIIRAVGNPLDRFKEDGLRMLRAIRFMSQLNFGLSIETSQAICDNAELIINISAERIQEELNKIILSNYPRVGIHGMLFNNLLKPILPELFYCRGCNQNNHHRYDVYDHIVETLVTIPNDLSLRLTALFHDIGKPKCKTTEDNGHVHFYGHDEISADMAKEIMTRLKYDNQMIEEVCYLVRYHMELMDFPTTDKGIRKLLNRHGETRLKKLVEFRRTDLLGSGTRDQGEVEVLIQEYRDRIEKVLQEKPPTQLVDLAIDGKDIMSITGLYPGEMIGRIKNKLMEIVIEDPELNTNEQLSSIVGEAMVDSFIDWAKE